MKSAADLYKKGFISEEGKAKILKLGNAYARSHNAAVEAFQKYIANEGSKDDAVRAMNLVLDIYSELLAVLSEYDIYGEPVKPWF
jgi:hypothetical protein